MMRGIQDPTRLVPLAFLVVVLVGTLLLMLPVARAGPGGAPLLTALFTATSAACVTGLIVVDTGSYWSPFGQVVILLLFQLGGFGIMTSATLLGMLISRRMRFRSRLIAQAETRSLALGDVTGILRLILRATLVVEAVTALVLILHLHLNHGEPWGEAAWHGLFHAVSAFNNAGFSTYQDSLMSFVGDPVMLLSIMLAAVIGGLGFPVLFELRHELRQPAGWSVHTKITLAGTVTLLVGGTVIMALYEWGNAATLGRLEPLDRLVNALLLSVMTRSTGFNSVEIGMLQPESLLASYGLMLIGGGSASTAGGIKVTTFVLLCLMARAEIRGQADTTAFNRRISAHAQRQAVTVALFAVLAVGIGTLLLLSVTDLRVRDALFEVISAAATVGLSTGVTAELSPAGQLLITALMFTGRVGTVTLATALALREHKVPFRYPEERPIIG